LLCLPFLLKLLLPFTLAHVLLHQALLLLSLLRCHLLLGLDLGWFCYLRPGLLSLSHFGEACLFFNLDHFLLDSFVYIEALLDDASELKHFIDGLAISFFLLFDYFEGAMFFAEDSVRPLPINPLNLHKVVGAPSTLNVERDLALSELALYASTLSFKPTDYTL